MTTNSAPFASITTTARNIHAWNERRGLRTCWTRSSNHWLQVREVAYSGSSGSSRRIYAHWVSRPVACCFAYAIHIVRTEHYGGGDSAHGLEQLEPLRRQGERCGCPRRRGCHDLLRHERRRIHLREHRR